MYAGPKRAILMGLLIATVLVFSGGSFAVGYFAGYVQRDAELNYQDALELPENQPRVATGFETDPGQRR